MFLFLFSEIIEKHNQEDFKQKINFLSGLFFHYCYTKQSLYSENAKKEKKKKDPDKS